MNESHTPFCIGMPGKRELTDLRCLQREDIELSSIIGTLENINRFAGRTENQITVARHSVFVSMILEVTGFSTDIVLAGLCHEFCEAYIGDIIKPVKDAFPELKELEKGITRQIAEHINIGFWQAKEVKWADMVAVGYEAEFCGFDTRCWDLPEHNVPKMLLDMCWAYSTMEMSLRYKLLVRRLNDGN